MAGIDLLDYLRGSFAPGQLAARPVGVTHLRDGGGPEIQSIFQSQRDGVDSRRFFQVKGSFGAACDWEELWYDDTFVYRAIDTSRPPEHGGPYTLYDSPGQRGSRWCKRHMEAGEVFERNPFVAAFDMTTGRHTRVDGPVRTWLKLAAVHETWHGVADVVELWWLTDGPTGSATERYMYARGLGLIGFTGAGMTTTPNYVWEVSPPAPGVPVLSRKAIGFTLPALPDAPPVASTFRLLAPLAQYAITDRFDAPRPYGNGKHEGMDFAPVPPGSAAPVRAGNAGVVEQVGDEGDTGYGKWARVRFDADGGQWRALYAHLSRVDAYPGLRVAAGQTLGLAGATGNATGVHVHLTLTHPTHGLDGYSVAKVVNPEPYLVAALPEPEPPVDDGDTQPVPAPEPDDTPPEPVEIEFATREEQQRVGRALVALGERIMAAPGRRVYLTVTTEEGA